MKKKNRSETGRQKWGAFTKTITQTTKYYAAVDELPTPFKNEQEKPHYYALKHAWK